MIEDIIGCGFVLLLSTFALYLGCWMAVNARNVWSYKDKRRVEYDNPIFAVGISCILGGLLGYLSVILTIFGIE